MKGKIILLSLITVIFLLVNLFISNQEKQDLANSESSEVAIRWFELQLDLVKTTPGFTPPVASRVFGYTSLALYESILPGNEGKKSLAQALGLPVSIPKISEDQSYEWGLVANTSLATMTRHLFPENNPVNRKRINDLEREMEDILSPGLDPIEINISKNYGIAVANSIIELAKTDGGDVGYAKNFPKDYVAPVGDGLWVPTAPDFKTALQPFWGDNKTFIQDLDTKCELPPHPTFSTDEDSDFYKEAYEVYEKSGNLSEEERDIALFWADDPGKTSTPPGHWISILSSILRNTDHSLAEASEIYARLGIALSDSFVSCWKEKYDYNLLRPITYIQDNIDEDWNTPEITDVVITPPFPEYPSGHSVQSGAAAVVLTEFFGDNFSFVDDTHKDNGYESRKFSSFKQAAEEAAISRLYGGIHYRAAIENGITLGNCIGEKINSIDLHNK